MTGVQTCALPICLGLRDRSGLSIIIQLPDGSYVILDGGYWGGMGGNEAGKLDREALYNFLVDNKPSSHEKPVISCWLLSHAHGDHDDAITVFLDKYRNDVELQMFAHHFPDFVRNPTVSEGEGQTHGYYGAITLQMVRSYCPNATEWVVHSGQKLYLGGAEIEVLYTCEDLYPIRPRGINDTNSTYRVTIEGVTIMLLGDSDSYANNQMASYYGEYLKSDVLQFAHHAYNGELAQYQLIDPKVCFWANYSWNLNTGRPCNQHLLNTKWSRTDGAGKTTSGNRQHVYNDYANGPTRVYLAALK